MFNQHSSGLDREQLLLYSLLLWFIFNRVPCCVYSKGCHSLASTSLDYFICRNQYLFRRRVGIEVELMGDVFSILYNSNLKYQGIVS